MPSTARSVVELRFAQDDVLNLLAYLEWLAGVNTLPFESTRVRENALAMAREIEQQSGLRLEPIELHDVSGAARRLRARHLARAVEIVAAPDATPAPPAPVMDATRDGCDHVPSLSGRCLACGLAPEAVG